MRILQKLRGKAKAVGSVVGLVALVTGVTMLSGCDKKSENAGATDSNIDYELADNIQDGVILHCFNWKYTDITAELKNIAAAGFTSVQTSPAQISVNAGWWKYLYEPLGFSIGTNDLGTKTELKDLCEEAEKYGIKVIVDVVANNLAADDNIQADLKGSEYWHTYGDILDFRDRNQITQGNLNGLPDLNHENAYIQQVVSNYINDLKNLGVDGIRWDSARNISLPSEGSTFWLGVTSQGLYHYGAIENGPDNRTEGNESLMKEYTEYMSVTDNIYAKELRDAFSKGVLPKTLGNWSEKGIEKNKLVYWAENHESWSNNGAYGYSNGMTQNVIDRAYAIVASQNGASALYFSRPDSSVSENIYAGEKGSTHFKSAEVAAINHFHNAMNGQKDAYGTGDSCAVVGRELGAVIVAAMGSDVYVTVPNPDGVTTPGTYKDVLTGKSWVVTSTTITGTIGSTGIAVIYGESVAPVNPNNSEDSGNSDNIVVTEGKVYYKNTEKWSNVYAYYWSKEDEQMCQWPGKAMTNIEENIYSVKLPAGCEYIIFNNGDQLKTLEISLAGAGKLYNNGAWSDYVEPENTIDYVGNIFFKNTHNWSNVYIYYWSEADEHMTVWPGEEMSYLGEGVYGYTVPEDAENVIFTDGSLQTSDILLEGFNMVYVNGKWTEPGNENSEELKEYVYFKNTKNWSTVCAYYWSKSNSKMIPWPGVEMESIGEDVFRIQLPVEAEYIIFSDGYADQTDDIELEGTNMIYIDTEWQEYN